MRRAHVLLTCVLSFSVISAGGLPAIAAAESSSQASSSAAAGSSAQQAPAARPIPTYTTPPPKAPPVTQPAKRVAEVVEERREFSQTFELSDGRREVELSTRPVHYRDGSGRWQPVDTRVVGSDRAGFEHRNGGGKFDASFGDRSDRLVRFEFGGRSIQLGVAGSSRAVKPSTSGSSLTFADVFGAADVRYTVESRKLKEDIVLQQAPPQAVFTFDVTLAGLKARSLGDGSIGFYSASDPDTMVLRMPRPFMTDSAADPTSPTGTGFSDNVTQSVVQNNGRTQITVRASDAWLRDAKRTYPVRIDPTIEVVATSTTGGQDAGIISGAAAGTNFGNSMFLEAGSYNNDKRRSLLKFDLGMIPGGTSIDSAQLRVHYDTTLDTAAAAATIEPRPVSAPWDESTVTWNSINTAATGGSMTFNLEQVDDQEEPSVSMVGTWPTYTLAGANLGSHHYNKDAVTGDSFTWYPDITEDGDYRVDVWYTAGSDRTTAAPFVVNHDGGPTAYTVNQTTGGGTWRTLGTHRFKVGGDNKVTLKDVAGGLAVVADGVRFVKAGQVVKPAGENNGTHVFSVRSLVQSWTAAQNPTPNNGFVLKLPDAQEGVGTVGPRYLSSEGGRDHQTGGVSDEQAVLPKLVVRYGRASVELAEPKKITSTGPALSWTDAPDPRATPEDAPVEYQVHRVIADAQADPYFAPSNATLVASMPKDESSFTDATAQPNTAYYYRVAVVTKGGEVAPSRTVFVVTPAAGRVIQVVQGDIADTTLSSATPTENQNVFAGQPKLSVGNTAVAYGIQRAVLKFDTSSVPAKAKVADAKLSLWKRLGATTAPTINFDLHSLTKGFVETQATWNLAANGSAWTGGEYAGAKLATANGADSLPARMSWAGLGLTTAVQGWVDNGGVNYGVLLKLADEAATQHRLEFWSGEYGVEPELRPQLRVDYVDPQAATFYGPETPQRMIPNLDYRFPVTVINTTSQPLAADLDLSYVWTNTDGSPVQNAGTSNEADLGTTLAPGQSTKVWITVRPPANSETGKKRRTYRLNWDLNAPGAGGAWLSENGSGIKRFEQQVDVEERQPHDTDSQIQLSYGVGFEKYFQYTGTATGAGSSAQVNLHTGNLLWTYAPISNPSIGPSTFVRLSYSSLDGTDSPIGHGFSLQTSTLTRGGSPLVFDNAKGLVSMIDGDGSSQVWMLNSSGTYESPAGVHLALRKLSTAPSQQAWVMTRPDGTKFYFDQDGYQTSVKDPNGNTMTFAYDLGTPKRLRKVTDASGLETLNLAYDTTTGRLQTLTDRSGRTLTFAYDGNKLISLTDAAAGVDAKVFEFQYSTDSTNSNIRLSRVRDPQRPVDQHTDFGYIESTTDSWSNGRVQSITDRRGKATTFTYADVNGADLDGMQATVTDANQHTTSYVIDDYGRPSSATNPTGKTTTLTWDGDNNVSRLAEANGAVTTWTYDYATGYPLTITDPEQNKTSSPKSTVLDYLLGNDVDGAPVKHLRQKKSPAGATWAFGYDTRGNLTAVTDPAGVATTEIATDYRTTYTYDPARGLLLTTTDANQHTTVYSKVVNNVIQPPDYHASGSPQTITDALGNATTFTYDVRGNVLSVKDANDTVTTQTYDGFGRPKVATVPIDRANNVFANTTTSYDRNDNVVETIAPNDAVTTNTYDAVDQPIETNLPRPTVEERKITKTYDPVGNLLTQVDPLGNVTGAAGHTTRFAYDELNQLVSATDAKGGITGYSYDTVGNVVKMVDALKSATSDPDDYTVKNGYDLNHRQISTTDAAGHTSRTQYDIDGQVARTIDADGNITTLSRDPRGLVTQVNSPYDVAGSGVDYTTAGFVYDQVGNRTQTIQPRGMATALAGDYTETVTYDELNRPSKRTLPYNTADAVYKNPVNVSYTYDKIGNLTGVTDPTDTATQIWNRYTHFDNGWIKTSTDPFGIQTDYAYTETGQQKARNLTSAAGTAKREMTWDYNTDGSLKSRSDFGAPAGISEVLADNSDQQATTPVGTWPVATTSTGYWGYNYQTHAAGTGTSSFTWDLTIPTTGSYEVKVRYPQVSGAATNTQYTVNHATGSTPVMVNQTTNAGSWVSLGTYTFNEGVGKNIKVTDAANGTVVADAVMLVRNDPAVPRESKDLAYTYDVNGNLTAVDNTASGATDYGVTYDELNRPTRVNENTGANGAKTDYTYDAVGHPDTVTIDQLAPLKDQFYDYTWDVRGLLGAVKAGETASDPAAKTTSYTYNNLGSRATETKGNSNKVTFSWFDNGLMASSREVKPNATSLVAEHILGYDLDGNRTSDTAKVLNSDTKALDSSTAAYSYEPRGRVTAVTRTGTGPGNESYTYTATSNISSQSIAGVATSFVYDRNRLQKATSGTSSFYNYDPFGRLDTISSGGAVTGRYVYDGFDRVVEQRTSTGAVTKTTKSTYDAWDRVASKTDATGKTSAMSYLGLSSQLLAELDRAANKPTEAYTFDAYGQRLTQTTTKTDGTSEDAWYGYNPHSDVETLTTSTGDTKSTYGYTAFGKDRTGAMTGVDKPGASTEPYNVYRFNGKRWDAASGDYDMGFRTYNPGLNRFTSRDSYNGALGDLNLGTDPWNTNRYTFAGGNPISRIELDGHRNEMEYHGRVDRSGNFGSTTDRVGAVEVTAKDPNTYQKAYDAAAEKRVGTGGGQHRDYALACTGQDVKVMDGDRSHSCGWSDVVFANTFAEEMCKYAGVHCRRLPSNSSGAGLYEMPAGMPLGGTAELPAGGRVSSQSGGYCSFSGETKVLMADGSTKPISKVKVGDKVMATDPKTGERGPRTVTRLWIHKDKVLDLEVDGDTITTTEDHPFWNATDGEFQRADHLDRGEQLLAADGKLLRVGGLRPGSLRVTTVYNLTVDGIHTYYVVAGTTPVLVHNTGPGDCKIGPDGWPVPTMDNCKTCAEEIQKLVGGDVYHIKDAYGAPGLGPSKRDPNGSWTEHYAVVKDGIAYDGFTGRTGMPLDTYRAQWEHGEYLSFTRVR